MFTFQDLVSHKTLGLNSGRLGIYWLKHKSKGNELGKMITIIIF